MAQYGKGWMCSLVGCAKKHFQESLSEGNKMSQNSHGKNSRKSYFWRKDLKSEPVDNPRILIVQTNIHPEHFTPEGINEEATKSRIENVFSFVEVHAPVHLILFPELTVPLSCIDMIKKWSKSHQDTIIIAGSHYRHISGDNVKISTSPVIYRGKDYVSDKYAPSRLEKTVIPGRFFRYFVNTPVGTLGVLICSDFLSEKARIRFVQKLAQKKDKLDILCVPSWEKAPLVDGRHYTKASEFCQEKDCFVLFANSFSPGIIGGRSAVFANVFNSAKVSQKTLLCHAHDKETSLTKHVICKRDSTIRCKENNCRYILVSCDITNKSAKVNPGVDDTPPAMPIYLENHHDYCSPNRCTKIKLVAFDLDGTLIRGAHHYSWQAIYHKLGIDDRIRLARKAQYLDIPIQRRTCDDYAQWCEDNKQHFTSTQYCTSPLTEAIMDELCVDFWIAEGTKVLLETLKKRGTKLILVSGGINHIGRTVLNREGLWNIFDQRFINKFNFDKDTNELTITPTSYDFVGKEHAIELMCSLWDIDMQHEAAFVGDARNDENALLCTGLGIRILGKDESPDTAIYKAKKYISRQDSLADILDIIERYECNTVD